MSNQPDVMPRAAVILLSLLLAACGQSGGQSAPGAGGPPGMGGAGAIRVVADPVDAETFVDRFTALGTAEARESINVTARVSSIVMRINFEEGQRVAPGQLLVELDTRETAANVALAEATLQQSRSQYRRSLALRETRAVSDADLEQLEAQMLIAEAQLEAARTRLDMLYVRAPFAGTIGLRNVSPGELVGPDTVITTLDDSSLIRLQFTVPEGFMATIAPGMTIRAQSATWPGEQFTGRVTVIDPRVDPVTRTARVIAEVPNSDNRLRPGMFMTAQLERSRDGVLLVPEEALVPRQGRQYLFIVENGRAVEREVELGIRAPGRVEIRRGLAPGELVVTEGVQRLRPGSPVELVAAR